MQDGQLSNTPFEDQLASSNYRAPGKPALQTFAEAGTQPIDPATLLYNFQKKINGTPDSSLGPQSPVTFSPTQVDVSGRYNWQRIGADNEDLYGQGQSWGDKAINGLLKGLNLAGTTFLQGTVGLLVGLGNVITGNGANSFYNNDFSNEIESWNKKTENWLPNYYTKRERDARWYEGNNLFTANFLFDKFIKNLGFSLGAIYSGAAVTKALKLVPAINSLFTGEKAIATLAQIEQKVATVPALQRSTQIANTIRQASDAAIAAKRFGTATERLLIGTLGAATEGGIEALQGLNEYRNHLVDEYTALNGVAPQGDDLDRINSYAENLGDARFMMNMAVLSATNYIMLPKILGSSYKTSKSLANKEINGVVKTAEGKWASSFSQLPKAGKLLSRVQGISGLFLSGTEGLEELSQYAIERGVQDYYNKAYRGEGASWLESIGEGYSQAVNSDEGMEQFLIGALSGGIQQSGLISTKGFAKSGKIKERGFTGQGGERGANTQSFISQLNDPNRQAKFKSEAWLKDMAEASARGINLQIEGENLIRQGDVLEAKDNEFDYLHNYLTPRIKHGRYDLVKDDIAQFQQQASTPQGLEELKAQNIANENDTQATFLQRLSNFEKHADNVNSLYQSLNLTYGGKLDPKTNQPLYSDTVIDKMVYAASKVADYDQRIPELSQELLGHGIVVGPILSSILETNVIPEKATKEALEQINNLSTLSEIKDNLKDDLRDVIELSKRRKYFIKEYDNIKQNPSNYQSIPQDIREDKATIKQRNDEGKVVKEEVEIGKEYSVESEPLFRDGNKLAVNPKITILSKTLGGEYEVRMPDGTTAYLKPTDLKDYSLTTTDQNNEELNKITENTIYNILNKEGYSAVVTPETPLSDLLEFVNTLNNNVLVNKIQAAVRKATASAYERIKKEREEREKLARDKALHDALFKAQSLLPESPTETPDEANKDDGLIDQQDLQTYPISTAFTTREIDPTFTSKPHLLREETFLNNYAAGTLTDKQGNSLEGDIRVLVVHRGNQDALGLSGIVELRNPIQENETPEAYATRLTNPETGTIVYVYVKQGQGVWEIIDETGKTLSTLSIDLLPIDKTDISKIVTSVAKTSVSISTKKDQYTNKTGLDAAAVEQAWLAERKKLLASTNTVLPINGFSRGIQQITSTSDRNPIVPTLTSQQVADKNPHLIKVSTLDEIFTPSRTIRYKAGKPYFQLGDNVIFVNNRTLTKNEADAVFLVLKEVAAKFQESLKANTPQLDKQLVDWLNSILYWHSPKQGDRIHNHQIYIHNGRLFISGQDTDIYFTPEQLDANRDPIINTFLLGNQAGRGTYHNVSHKNLSADEPYVSYYTEDGTTLKTKTYPSYQAYLLENQVVTTNVRPQTSPTDSNIRGRYAIIDIDLNLPKPAEKPATPAPKTPTTQPVKTNGPKDAFSELLEVLAENEAENKAGTKKPPAPKPPVAPTTVSSVTPLSTFKAPSNLIVEAEIKLADLMGQGFSDSVKNDDDDVFRRVVEEDHKNVTPENWPVVEQWFKRNLPNVPVERVRHLLRITSGGWAWGKFGANGITLYENAKEGTGYHEAFEAVWALFTTADEKLNVLSDMRKRKGSFFDVISKRNQDYKSATDVQLKEVLADDFAAFVQNDGKVIEKIKNQSWIIRIFKSLYEWIKSLSKPSQVNVDDLFRKINTGWYASRPVNIFPDIQDEFSRVAGLNHETTKELMEDMTSRLLNNFFGPKASLSLANLSDNRTIPLDTYYDRLKKPLIERFIGLGVEAKAQGDMDQFDTYITIAHNLNVDWDNVVNLNKEYLKAFGIAKRENDNATLADENIKNAEQSNFSEDEQLEEEPESTFESENKSQLEYDRDIFTISGKGNASAGIRLLLSTIRDAYKLPQDKNDPAVLPAIEFNKSSTIKGYRFVPYAKVFNQLANALVNTNGIENILNKLIKHAKQNAPIINLVSRLGINTSTGEINYSSLSYNEWRILLDFIKTMSKQRPNAYIYSNEGGAAKLMAGDKASGIEQIKKNFTKNVKNNKELFVFNKQDKVLNLNKEFFTTHPKPTKDEDYIKLLNALGFRTVEGDLLSLVNYRSLSPREKETFKAAVNQVYTQLSKQKPIYDTAGKALQLATPINTIATSIITMTKDDGVNTFLNILTKPVQAVVLNNPLATFFNNFNSAQSVGELLENEKGLNNGFSVNSVVMEGGGRFFHKDGTRTNETIEIGYFDGVKNIKGAKQSAKLSLINRRLNTFNLNLRGWFVPITNGDKKTEWMLSMGNSISYKEVTSGAAWDRVYTIFQNYLKTEIDVAQTDDANNLLALKKQGRANKLRFFLDILPANLVKKAHEAILDLTPADEFISQNSEAINKAVKIFLEKEANKTKSDFYRYGIFTEISDKVFRFTGVDEKFIYDNINDNGANRWTAEQLDSVVLYRTINQVINNIELHKLVIGDPAFMTDPAKRIPGAMGGVNQSVYGSEAFNTYFAPLFNRVDVHNPSVALTPTDYGYTALSEDVSIVVYNDIIVKGRVEGKDYDSTNETDGASKMILPAYRELKSRTAEWTDQQEQQYQWQMAFFRDRASKLWGYKYSSKELQAHDTALLATPQPEDSVFEILKPKGWAQNNSSDYKDIVYLKTSTQPLIPTAIVNTNDEKLLRKMLDEGVKVAAFESAIKTGARTLTPLYDNEGKFNKAKYPADGILKPTWKDVGIQVETQFSQGKKTVTFGSQLSTMSALNLLSGGTPEGFTASNWQKLSEEEKLEQSPVYAEVRRNDNILRELVTNGYTALLEKLGIEETAEGYNITDAQKVVDYLVREARDMDDNTREALQIDVVANQLVTPLEAIPTYTQLKAVLYSIVDKNIASPKTSGIGLVQMPSTGTENEDRIALVGNSTYKFYTKEEPWIEVSLPAWFRDKLVLYYTKRNLPVPSEDALLKLINDSSILDGIGFRIPTQELNSMEVFKIKSFLPRVMGNAVIVPSEITTKAGSDFDIDKLTTYLKNVSINSKGEVEKVKSFDTEAKAKAYFAKEFDKRLEEKKKKLEKAEKAVARKQSIVQDYIQDLLPEDLIDKYSDLIDETMAEFDDPSDAEHYFISTLESFGEQAKKLNDEEFQSLLKETYIRRNVRKSLENAYYESLQTILQLPQNFERLTQINTTKDLEDIKNTLNKALFTPEEIKEFSINVGEKAALSYLAVLSPNSLDEIRHNLITGKDGVGIAAAAQKSNSIMQRLAVTIDPSRRTLLAHLDPTRVEYMQDGVIRFPHNTINGKPTISLSKTKKGKKYISDVISQYINGFVDIVKNTFIIEMGINTRTAGTFLFMDRLGNDTEHTTYFMNQPIIREYIKTLDETGINGIRSKNAVKEITEKWGAEAYQGDEQLPSAKHLLANIEFYKEKNRDFNNLPTDFIQEQAKIFLEFIKYQEMAGDLFSLMQGINWDTAHMSDPEQFLLKDVKFWKANNTIFTPAEEILNEVFIGDVKSNLEKARNAVGSFIAIEHPKARNVLDAVKKTFINPGFFPSADAYSKIASRINNSFINYILQVKGKLSDKTLKTILLDEATSAAREIEYLKENAPKDGYLHYILKRFSVERRGPYDDSVKAILFRKAGNDKYDRNSDIDMLRILKENAHTQGLYGKIVRAALLQSGAQYSPIAFSNLIPNEDYAAALSDLMKGIPYYTDLENYLTSSAFVRNNWSTNGVVPVATLKSTMLKDTREEGGRLWAGGFSMPKALAHFPPGSLHTSIQYKGDYLKYQPFNSEGLPYNSQMKYVPGEHVLLHAKTAFEENNPVITRTYLYQAVKDEYGQPVIIKSGKYDVYLYRAINAWGDGMYAQEYYDTPRPSQISNNTFQVDENQVNDATILKALGRGANEFPVASFEELKNQLPKKDCN